MMKNNKTYICKLNFFKENVYRKSTFRNQKAYLA